MKNVLQIENITKKFGYLIAVENLSFNVEKGCVYGLLGPNGSGKSTTLGMILGVVNPTEGNWKWFGESHSHQHLKRIGALIEHPNFYPNMTAKKNLEIVAQIKGLDYSNIQTTLEWVGLGEWANHKFKNFSLGMKQRLAIGSALLNNPDVLILDEPTNGLDPQGIADIREMIMEIAKRGVTIILASHLLDEVEKVCSHVVVLRKGKTLYQGRVDEMIAELGYFQLKSSDLKQLESVLNQLDVFEKIVYDEGFLNAYLKKNYKAEDLAKYLANKDIYLSHISHQKNSLEKQFLELVKQ